MKQILIIPDRNHLQECLELVKEYNVGFEYNDFIVPDVLDDGNLLLDIIQEYKREELPEYCTMHGTYLDISPFSIDKKIQKISNLRIEQSLGVARRIGAKAVVFHTNYNPFLIEESYIESWIDINEKYWSNVLEQNSDLNIYLENMFDATPDIIAELSERLSRYENYGVCLDWTHAALSKVDASLWAERLGKYVKHVHINDNELISDLPLSLEDKRMQREVFFESYEKYMKGTTVLIKTASMENAICSIEILKKEGFLET